MDKWPERLSIRDTKIYDDLGGLGQRIFTTAGAAYEKHTYYSEEYVSAKQARIEALEAAATDVVECGVDAMAYDRRQVLDALAALLEATTDRRAG